MIRDEVNQAAKEVTELLVVVFDPTKSVTEKITGGVSEAIQAIDELADFKALGSKDRTLGILDVLEEALHTMKGSLIKYSDEQAPA